MNRLACLLLLTLPLAAQSPFRATRHAGLPAIAWGDKFAAGDVDGDGDVDLVVANDNAANQLLLNDGRGRFTDATTGRLVTPLPNASHSVDLADIDGDGDLDILFGNDDWLSNRVYRNNGTGFFTDVTATALPPNAEFTQNQVVADFDGDGDVDWFTVDAGVCHFYRNNGAGVFTDASATALGNLPTDLGSRYDITARAADVDGDGDLDALVPDQGGYALLILNQNGVLVPSTLQPRFHGGTNWFADIDGDGDADVLADQGLVVLANLGNGTFADVTRTAFGTSYHQMLLGSLDVDGDGDLDLVSGVSVFWNNGAGVFTTQVATTSLQFGLALGSAAADFDGDGDIDLPGLPNFLRQVHAPTAPARGGTYTLELHAAAGSTCLAFGALGPAWIPMAPIGTLQIDPLTFRVLAAGVVGTAPTTLSWPVPNQAVLVGQAFHFQAYLVDPTGGGRLSNAIGDAIR